MFTNAVHSRGSWRHLAGRRGLTTQTTALLIILVVVLLGGAAGATIMVLQPRALPRPQARVVEPIAPAREVPAAEQVAPVQTLPHEVMTLQQIRTNVQLDPDGYPLAEPSWVELRQPMWSKQYGRATTLLEGYRELLRQDPKYEDVFYLAMSAYGTSPDYLPIYNAWIKGTPGNPLPLLARATLYVGLGWSARGDDWGGNTSPEQFEEMHKYFELAAADLEQAIALDRGLAYPYELLLEITRAGGGRYGDAEEIFRRGIAAAPSSYRLRVEYMQQLLPRWGGSHEAMRVLAEESQAAAGGMPRMRMLFAYIPWDDASMKAYGEPPDYEGAVVSATEALQYGPHYSSIHTRATALRELGRYDEAAADYLAASRLRPQNQHHYKWLVYCLVGAGRMTEARVYYDDARTRFGDDNRDVKYMASLVR